MGRLTSTAPSLRQLTPQASFLLVAAAGAWAGVAVLARGMGAMPGTMGLGIGSFVAVWMLMMSAMMLPSVAPFASLYMRTFEDRHGLRLAGFASGYLVIWTLAALPAFGLAWLAGRLAQGHPATATALAAAIFAACGIYQLTPAKEDISKRGALAVIGGVVHIQHDFPRGARLYLVEVTQDHDHLQAREIDAVRVTFADMP